MGPISISIVLLFNQRFSSTSLVILQSYPITECQQHTMLNYHPPKSVTKACAPSLSNLEEQVDTVSGFLDAEFVDFTLAVDAKVSLEGTVQTHRQQHPIHCKYVSFVRSFFAGRGSSLLWTPAMRPYSGPVRLPRERKGIGRCVRCMLAKCRVKERLIRSEQLVGYFYSTPLLDVAYCLA